MPEKAEPERQSVKRLAKKLARTVIRKLQRLDAVNRLLTRAFMEEYHLPVKPLHYYSPLPDIEYLKSTFDRWYQPGNWNAVELNLDKQREFLDRLKPFKAECASLPDFAEVSAAGYGPGFGEVEAQLLHCVIRYLKPKRVIEVGSGVSTFFIGNALAQNRTENNQDNEMICIEPFPGPQLPALIKQHGGMLDARAVQEIEVPVFEQLEASDLLFIDSTHVSKLASDVNYLYLDVLPALRKGVWIHIHDISFPYLVPPPEHPLFDLYLLWNEAPLVKAFLMYNSAFQIRIAQSFLHHKYPEALAEVFSVYDRDKHFPLSLWLEKVE